MTRELVFVHGRSQQNKDADALKKAWIDALSAGLAKSKLTLPSCTAALRYESIEGLKRRAHPPPVRGALLDDLLSGHLGQLFIGYAVFVTDFLHHRECEFFLRSIRLVAMHDHFGGVVGRLARAEIEQGIA